ncbi:MAG: hypothetical protein RDU30_09835 [Desulfovibrionaceae bacterium]|nr:hypothetical protein [Desulfovibrionaceae bacterium]
MYHGQPLSGMTPCIVSFTESEAWVFRQSMVATIRAIHAELPGNSMGACLDDPAPRHYQPFVLAQALSLLWSLDRINRGMRDEDDDDVRIAMLHGELGAVQQALFYAAVDENAKQFLDYPENFSKEFSLLKNSILKKLDAVK